MYYGDQTMVYLYILSYDTKKLYSLNIFVYIFQNFYALLYYILLKIIQWGGWIWIGIGKKLSKKNVTLIEN